MSDFRHVVALAYREILLREPDADGLLHHNARMQAGLTEAQLREDMLRSPEFAERFPDTGPPPPPPSPDPMPTMPELRYENSVFTPEVIGATICCDDPETPDVDEGIAWGWPLVIPAMLDRYAAAGINITELRPGPFRSPAPEALLPELTRTVRECEARGIYALIGLIDHWALDHDETPWGDGLEVTARAPEQRHKDWIRQVIEATCQSPAAVYFDGNESFKGERSEAWIRGIYRAVQGALEESGRSLFEKLIGSNSGRYALDFVVGHGWRRAVRGELLIESDNEPHSPEDWLDLQRRSRANGGYLLAWKGPMSDAEWFRLLPLFGGGAAPVPAPTPCGVARMPECSAPGSEETGIYGCCRMVEKHGDWCGPSRFQWAVDEVLDEIVAERGTNQVADEAEFTAEVARRLRLRGLCATTKMETPGGGSDDEVGVKDSNDRSEQFDIVFANGRVRKGGYVAVCKPARF